MFDAVTLLPITLQLHYSLPLLSTLPLHCSYSAETLQFLDNEILRGSGMRCLVVLHIRTHSHADTDSEMRYYVTVE